MPSLRQLAANRRNGAKGGPKTEAGKQRCRANSTKHGLTSSTLVVLPEEHEREYEEVLRGFRDSFQPCDASEDALVTRLAQAHWRSLRSRRIETEILNTTANVQRRRARNYVENCPEHLDPHGAIAAGFMTMSTDHWQMYMRYDTAISREFFKTLDALTRLQRVRKTTKQPVDATPQAPRFFAAGAGAGVSDCGIGSVSQNIPTDAEVVQHSGYTDERYGRQSAGDAEVPPPAAARPCTTWRQPEETSKLEVPAPSGLAPWHARDRRSVSPCCSAARSCL